MSMQIYHHKRINVDADLYDSRWKNIRLPKILINLKLITLPILCNEKWPRDKRAKQSLIFPIFIISSRIYTPIDYIIECARAFERCCLNFSNDELTSTSWKSLNDLTWETHTLSPSSLYPSLFCSIFSAKINWCLFCIYKL